MAATKITFESGMPLFDGKQDIHWFPNEVMIVSQALLATVLGDKLTLACHTCWTLKTALSDAEITIERRYIMAERLSVMLPDVIGMPTDQRLIAACAEAIANADDWETRYMDSI